jgi:hypothetical protein
MPKSTMNKLLAPLLILLAAPLPAFANTYEGTLTEVIDDTGGFPYYHVGETFQGWYEYTSPTIDGSFYTQNGGNGDEPNQSLNGFVLIPEPYVGPSYEQLVDSVPGGGSLTVSSGVPDFYWQEDDGGVYTEFYEGSLSSDAYDLGGGPDGNYPEIVVYGTYSVGAPTLVPESMSAIWPTSFAMCVLLFWRARKGRPLVV